MLIDQHATFKFSGVPRQLNGFGANPDSVNDGACIVLEVMVPAGAAIGNLQCFLFQQALRIDSIALKLNYSG